MSLKHVCMIGPVPPPWGGVETHMMGLRDRLRFHGLRCSVVNYTRHRQPDHDDLYFPQSPQAALLRIHELRPDIVHVHLGGSFFTRDALLFLMLSARLGTANVFTFHSGGFPRSPEGLRASPWSLRGIALQRLDAIIGVNAELVEVFEKYGVPQERIHLIEPHGAAVNREKFETEPLSPEIAEFVQLHHPLFVSVAQLEPEYGIDVQIAAFTAIRQEYPNAGLLVLGSGSLRAALEEQISAIPDAEHIVLCGDMPRPKTLSLIARANLMLRTTHYDGDALSVREALALGTRVLATDTGMRPDGVQLLKTLDAPSLAAAITPALESETHRTLEASDSDTENPMDKVVSLYESLKGKRAA